MTFTHKDIGKKKRPFVKEAHRDGGHYYLDEDGNEYPSITTIKNLTDPKDWYPYWIKKIMWNNDVGEKEAKVIATQISNSSMEVGTELHRLAECYLNNDSVMCYDKSKYEKDPYELFVPLKKWLDDHVDNIHVTESRIFNKELQLAGTVDWVAELDGVLTIGDFKNSRKPKVPSEIIRNKYYEQICAYGKMFEECYGIHIEQGVIIVISWDGKVRPFKVNLKDYESSLLDIIIKYESEIKI